MDRKDELELVRASGAVTVEDAMRRSFTDGSGSGLRELALVLALLTHMVCLVALVLLARAKLGAVPAPVFFYCVLMAAAAVRPFEVRPVRCVRWLVLLAGASGVLLVM